MDDDPTLLPDGDDAGVVRPAGNQPLPLRIEALLLSTDRPLSDGKIAELLGVSLEDGGSNTIRQAIDELNQTYDESHRSFRIEAVAGGRQVLTRPEFGPVLHRLHQERLQTRLTPAAMETLAIVAYRQPMLRAEVEAIRGVACGEVLRGLMERRLIKIVGRAEEIGRPMLYGTTREFLNVFGLAGLEDLPEAKELRQPSVAGHQIAGTRQSTSESGSGPVDPEPSSTPAGNPPHTPPGTLPAPADSEPGPSPGSRADLEAESRPTSPE